MPSTIEIAIANAREAAARTEAAADAAEKLDAQAGETSTLAIWSLSADLAIQDAGSVISSASPFDMIMVMTTRESRAKAKELAALTDEATEAAAAAAKAAKDGDQAAATAAARTARDAAAKLRAAADAVEAELKRPGSVLGQESSAENSAQAAAHARSVGNNGPSSLEQEYKQAKDNAPFELGVAKFFGVGTR